MENMPMIFQTSTLTYEERFPIYWDKVLGNCKASEVKTKFADFVEKCVQKRGWKAIWSCADVDTKIKENVNVLVEVVNVFPQSLSSEVNICVPVVANPPITFQQAQALIQERDNCIPLMELLPVFDESGDFDQTALALEHVRFFFENLWRDWDLDDDEDYSFTACHLENRLRLYYDITQNNLSKQFIRKYNATLSTYKQKLVNLKELRKNISASDSEQELDTSDVFMLAQKRHELEDIVRSLQTMEDPQMRYLLASVSSEKPAMGQIRAYPITMIVAEKLTAKMTKSLTDETVIEHCTSLEKAVDCLNMDDSIIIYSGSYTVGTMVFKHSLKITGNGNVIVECDEDDDNFLTIQSPSIEFNNIKFIHTSSSSPILVVEKGQTVLRNCEFRCHSDGIVIKHGVELVMENCKVYSSTNAGVTIEENSKVHIQKCEICNQDMNKNSAVIKIFSSARQPSDVTIAQSRVANSSGINIIDGEDIKIVTESISKGVRLKLENNTFDCAAVL